jgi:TetR/AcrR family transcriptional repressor of nem operon
MNTLMNAPLAANASTREKIMKAGEQLLRTRSYLGFSFQDIANEVGIRKPSLHHHFASKEVLGLELLRDATQRFKGFTTRTPADPVAKLDAYVAMYRNSLHAGDAVCPAGAFAPGWDCTGPELKAAVRELRTAHIVWLAGVVGALNATRHLGDPAQVAASVFAACQGGLISARVTGSAEDFDDSVALIRTSWAA